MTILPRKNQHGPIAIELGAESLRSLQLERRGGKLSVRHFCQQPVAAPAAVPAAAPGESTPAVQTSLVSQLPRLNCTGFAGRDVVVTLSPPDVECTPLRVPENVLKLNRQTLLGAIRHEVGRNISLPIDDVEMDVWPLLPGHMESPNLMVTAAPRQNIQQVLNWLDAQRLVCRRLEVGPLTALRACVRLSDGPEPDHLWGVLDFGRTAVRLYIGIGAVPVYVRCMVKAGEEMTRRISEELGIARPIAESYKRHYGVQAGDGHYRPMTSGQEAVDSRRMAGILLGVLRPIIRGVGEEIQRSFRYAMGLYPDRPISGLWLIGGGANLSGLPEMLHEMLGIGVHRVAAGALVGGLHVPSTFSDEVALQMAGCLGLGFGEMN